MVIKFHSFWKTFMLYAYMSGVGPKQLLTLSWYVLGKFDYRRKIWFLVVLMAVRQISVRVNKALFRSSGMCGEVSGVHLLYCKRNSPYTDIITNLLNVSREYRTTDYLNHVDARGLDGLVHVVDVRSWILVNCWYREGTGEREREGIWPGNTEIATRVIEWREKNDSSWINSEWVAKANKNSAAVDWVSLHTLPRSSHFGTSCKQNFMPHWRPVAHDL